MIKRRSFLTHIYRFITAFILSLLFSLSVPLLTGAKQPSMLTISAGAGLRNAMLEIQKTYVQDHPNITLIYNFAASGVLRRQIEQGAPVDVVLMASQEDMDALKSQNLLLKGTRKNLLKSEVALIVPKNFTGIYSFQDLTHKTIKRIAIGEPKTVPLGQYAEEVFNYFKIHEQVQPKLVYARSALEIMTYVESGNVDAGIVHDTNARQSNQVRVVAIAPSASHTPVIYPIAILKNSPNLNAAQAFLQFLSSAQAKAIFQKYGYSMP